MNTLKEIAAEPLVSICISVFNEERFLAETLDSLLNQTYRHFEVIIRDNASTDKTPEICRRYAGADPRFRLFQYKVNIGQVNNISRSYVGAGGDLVLLLSGNDILAPSYLEKVVTEHLANPNAGLIFTRSTRIDESSKPLGKLPDKHYFETDHGNPAEAYSMVLEQFRDPGAFFSTYKREVLESLQPLRHSYGSDQIFVAEAALYGDIKCVNNYLFFSRVHKRQALPSVFSEYHSRSVPINSIFHRIDVLTPIISLIAGHVDMISKSNVAPKDKKAMVEIARDVCIKRGEKRITKERMEIADYAEQFCDNAMNKGNAGIQRQIGRNMILNRLLDTAVVVPEDERVKGLICRLSNMG